MLIVSVDIGADVPVMLTDAGGRLHVGAKLTPVRLVITTHVRLTAPVKPLDVAKYQTPI